jgi:hypothetical protein
MKNSDHFNCRSASRGFGEYYSELLEKHGDYIEQKGGCYVLRLSDARKIRNLELTFASELQELNHKRKLLKRKRKALGMHLVKPARNIDQMGLQEREISREIRMCRNKKKAVKRGYGVFGKKTEGAELTAVTVAHICKRIRGYNSISE